MNIDDSVRDYMSKLGKKSWEKQKDKKTPEDFKKMQEKGLKTRRKNAKLKKDKK